MNTVRLKFASEQLAKAAMVKLGFEVDEDGKWFKQGHSIVKVTPIKKTGVMITDEITGGKVPEVALVDGVHFDVLCTGDCCESNVAVDHPCHRFAL